MRRMLRALALFAVLVAGFAVAAPITAPPAVAGVDDFSFRSLDVDYTLGRAEDGTSTLRVVETFVAKFPEFDQNRGMRRYIPETYNGVPLHPTLVSLTDGDGRPRPVETDSEDGYLVVTSRADDFVHGAQTYVFTYTMVNATWHFDDTDADEFYWDVNGTGWAQPFGSVTATVHLDPELAGALTGSQACYRGYQGASDRCEITLAEEADGSATVVAQASDLSAYQTMTIAIGFESGTFTPFDASYLASPWGWVQGGAGLAALGALGWAIGVRRRTLADAPGRGLVIPEYTSPPTVDALLGAVLLGKTSKAIPAEVLEQAVVGSIRIVEGGRTWTGKPKLRAELVDPSRADGDGIMLIDGLFGPIAQPGDAFEFGRSDSRFAKAAQHIVSWAGKELVARGLRRKVAASARAWPVLIGIAALVVVFFTGIAALDAGVVTVVPILVIIAAVAAVVAVFILVSRKPLTALGTQTREHLLGLKMFIEWAEADRIRMLQSPTGAERVRVDVNDPRQMLHLYETLLPFAVVFGQEREWSDRLAVLYTQSGATGPSWYYGTGAFNAAAFSAGIGSLSASAASASSTSGGSGGGGSAGGGGGGGGGGGV